MNPLNVWEREAKGFFNVTLPDKSVIKIKPETHEHDYLAGI